MAGPYYVDDGGDNSDGSTWAKAYTSIENVDSVAAAGDIVYIGSDHQETKNGSAFNITFSNGTIANPVIVISADITSGEPPSTYESMNTGGGYIQTTGITDGINLGGHVKWYGVKFDSEDELNLLSLGNVSSFIDCYFDAVDNCDICSTTESSSVYENCTFANSDYCFLNQDSSVHLKGCTFSSADANGIFYVGLDSARLLVEDCDLSTEATLLYTMNGKRVQCTFRRCKLHGDTLDSGSAPKFNVYAGTIVHPDTWVLLESCDDDTSANPFIGLNYFGGYYGYIIPDTSEYRTGGASDGTTNYSWKMVCNGNTVSRHCALKSPPIVAWVTETDTTLTVYVAHDGVGDGTAGDLQDDELWLEISSPDETNDPATAEGHYQDTLPATVLTAASDLTNEGSDQWQNTPTSYQQVTATIGPNVDGPVKVRVCLATGASSTMWVDPKVHVS